MKKIILKKETKIKQVEVELLLATLFFFIFAVILFIVAIVGHYTTNSLTFLLACVISGISIAVFMQCISNIRNAFIIKDEETETMVISTETEDESSK